MPKPRKLLSALLHNQRTKFHKRNMEKIRKKDETIRIPKPILEVSGDRLAEYFDYKSKLQVTVNMTCRICGHFITPPSVGCRVCGRVYHAMCIDNTNDVRVKPNWTCHFCECIWLLLPEDEKRANPCLPCINVSRQVFEKIWPLNLPDDRRNYFDQLDVEHEGKLSYRVYLIAFTLSQLKNKKEEDLVKYLTVPEVLKLRGAFAPDAVRDGTLGLPDAREATKKWLDNYGIHPTLTELYSSTTNFGDSKTTVDWRDFLARHAINAIALRPNLISPKINFLWLVN